MPEEMVLLALTEADTDRLWACLRYARCSLETVPETDDEVEAIKGLEDFVARSQP